jgi:hypothetical protein
MAPATVKSVITCISSNLLSLTMISHLMLQRINISAYPQCPSQQGPVQNDLTGYINSYKIPTSYELPRKLHEPCGRIS